MEIKPCVNTEIEHLLYRCLSTNVHGNRDLNVRTSGASRGWINEEKRSLEICSLLLYFRKNREKDSQGVFVYLFSPIYSCYFTKIMFKMQQRRQYV